MGAVVLNRILDMFNPASIPVTVSARVRGAPGVSAHSLAIIIDIIQDCTPRVVFDLFPWES